MRTTLYNSMTDTWGSKEDITKARKGLEPDSWDVRTARKRAGFTMQEAADTVYVSRLTWLRWERDKTHPDYRAMSPAYAELFALKSGITTIEQLCPHLSKLHGKD